MQILPLANIIQPGMRGVFYGRHSTNKQTMDTQRSMAYEFSKKYDCPIVKEYEDAGVSARKKTLDQREGISQLLKDALDGLFDFVIINNHDRIARNPMEHQKIRMILSGCRINVVVSSNESLYDSGDFIVDLIKDGTSKFEVDNTRIRTRDTIRSIAKSGKWSGGKAPFGYRYDKEKKIFHEVEADLKIVLRIYELYRNNEGFQSVATILNKETGKTLTKAGVRWIITNPFYSGYISLYRKTANSRNTITTMDNWMLVKSELIKPIMTLDEWKVTWMIYEQRKLGNLSPNMYKTSFWLSNLLKCSICGGVMVGKDQTTYDKTRMKHYGKHWYFCKTCNYKIEAGRVHSEIKDLLVNLKLQNLELISKKIIEECSKDREKFKQKAHDTNLEITKLEQLSAQAEVYGKQFMTTVKDLETLDEKTRMVQILMLQKQDINVRLVRLKKELNLTQKTLSYLEKIEGNESNVVNRLKAISDAPLDNNDRDLRKMLTHLIQEAILKPISINDKNQILKASLAIQTRNNLSKSTII